ncbi:MAG: DMT family transporter [Pseudomonadota bacterium]|nr:DMT family transporter [Pseudomonadota bacterium]
MAYFLIVLATFLWAASIVIIRGVHEQIPPLGLSFLRWFLGALFLLPFVWKELFRKTYLIKQHFLLISSLGVLQVGSSVFLVLGVNFTSAINASVINASQPGLTAAIAWILLKDKVNLTQTFGIIVGLLGIVTIITRAKLETLLLLDMNLGDGLVLLAIIGWGTYAVLMPRVPKQLGMTTFLFLILFIGSLASLPFYIFESLYIRTVPYTIDTLITLIVLGIIVSVGSIYVWNAGIRAVGPNRASIFLNLIPVFGAVLAILFLGEVLFVFHFIGALLVFFGISLVIKRH